MNSSDRADAVFDCICDYMKNAKLKFEANRAEGSVTTCITGEDFPVTLVFGIDAERQRVDVYSRMPYTVRNEKTVDIALAIAAINCRIALGKYCLYMDERLCTYEASVYFNGLSGFGQDFARLLVGGAYTAVEDYNDTIYSINRGLLDAKTFVSNLSGGV